MSSIEAEQQRVAIFEKLVEQLGPEQANYIMANHPPGGWEQLATKQDLKEFATKQDLKEFATKQDLKEFATKQDLKEFATKQDLKEFATKQDLKALEDAIKQDLPSRTSRVCYQAGVCHQEQLGSRSQHSPRRDEGRLCRCPSCSRWDSCAVGQDF